MATPAERIAAAQARVNARLNTLKERPGVDLATRLQSQGLVNTATVEVLVAQIPLLTLLGLTAEQLQEAVAERCEAIATQLEAN